MVLVPEYDAVHEVLPIVSVFPSTVTVVPLAMETGPSYPLTVQLSPTVIVSVYAAAEKDAVSERSDVIVPESTFHPLKV